MSTTRLQEVQICFGFGKQTDIATANLVAAMWRLKKLNAQLANPKLNSWPLPYSSASFSVFSFGLASWALSFFRRHIAATRLAVAMSVCLPKPKQICTSCSLVVDMRRYLLGVGRRLALAPASHEQ